jgi:hypothetical protein
MIGVKFVWEKCLHRNERIRQPDLMLILITSARCKTCRADLQGVKLVPTPGSTVCHGGFIHIGWLAYSSHPVLYFKV